MKLAMVVPRYGPTVTGGAETAARLLAEQLVARRGWDIEVLTTTAMDLDWNDGFEPGTTTIGGVLVHRFSVAGRRSPDFEDRSARIIPAPRRASGAQERGWLDAQGPVSQDLIEAIAACDADGIAFHPYLYHPSVVGAAVARRPTILHGAAHDEPALGLGIYRDLYRRVDGLAFWSGPERELIVGRFEVGATPQAVIGLGVEAGPGEVDAARSAVGLGECPYVICLGRVDDGKGAALLARMFDAYAQGHDDDLRLVFAGAVADRPPAHPRVIVAGPVDEATKWGLLRGAVALVSPSAMESFGIALSESWSVGRPVLVNRRCEVAAQRTVESQGGLVFGNYAEFEIALERISSDVALASALGSAGRLHTETHYCWEAVLGRYGRLVAMVCR